MFKSKIISKKNKPCKHKKLVNVSFILQLSWILQCRKLQTESHMANTQEAFYMVVTKSWTRIELSSYPTSKNPYKRGYSEEKKLSKRDLVHLLKFAEKQKHFSKRHSCFPPLPVESKNREEDESQVQRRIIKISTFFIVFNEKNKTQNNGYWWE